MNTKKKFLSFALACLMIAMTFSAAIPVFAADNVAKIFTGVTDDTPDGYRYYSVLDDAFEAAQAEQTVEILKDVTIDEIKTGHSRAFTVKPETGLDYVTITLTKDSIVTPSVDTPNNITFQNIKFIQSNKQTDGTTDNTAVFVHVRGNSTYTFNDCTFTSSVVPSWSGYESLFIAHGGKKNNVQYNTSGILNMNDCVINYQNENSDIPMFSVNTDTYTFEVNLNGVEINAAGNNPIFRMCSTMTVNIMGKTTVSNGTGAFIEKAIKSGKDGGTINILNGKTYGGFEAPQLKDGASVRTTEGSSGIRFTASLSKAVLEGGAAPATYGMLLTKTESVPEDKEFIEANLTAGSYKMGEIWRLAIKNQTRHLPKQPAGIE